MKRRAPTDAEEITREIDSAKAGLIEHDHSVMLAQLEKRPKQLLTPENHPAVFRAIALFLPRRLYIEDLGDALEVLAMLERTGRPRWQRWVKIGSMCFFLLLNTVREVISAAKGNSGSVH
jgi:hypothetical protein